MLCAVVLSRAGQGRGRRAGRKELRLQRAWRGAPVGVGPTITTITPTVNRGLHSKNVIPIHGNEGIILYEAYLPCIQYRKKKT